jgi:hypothetical protein
MSFIGRRYLILLEKYPLVTKSISAGVIGFWGDVLAQSLHGKMSWNPTRSLQLGIYGLLFAGPLTHVWYNVLERWAGNGTSFKIACIKTLLDQTIAAPIFTCLFFTVNSAMSQLQETHTFSFLLVQENVEKNWWSTLIVNWSVWPACMLIGMRWIPLHMRVLYGNVLGVFWGAYLSRIQHQDSMR